MESNNKKNYYDLTKGMKPHLNVLKFLDLNIPPHKAIDLGCGDGRDTIALLKNEWEVLSIDKENTEHIIIENLAPNELKKFTFKQSLFGEMNLPQVDLIVANFSLPFSKKDKFNLIWKKIVDSILIERILCR